MHRGAGLAAFQRDTQTSQSFAALSNTISETQIDNLRSQLSSFRNGLLHFTATHRDDIRRDPAFRQAFQQMCVSIGVDPLAGPHKGGWWDEMLGLGDWQYELGVQIVDICVSTRDRNGGLIEMKELLRVLSKLRSVGGQDSLVSEEDVLRSIKTLKPLGAGYEVIKVGDRKMIQSVVKELDGDQATVLAEAQRAGGKVDELGLMKMTSWTRERTRTALNNLLMRDGLCWIDEQDEDVGTAYWVPSAMTWDD